MRQMNVRETHILKKVLDGIERPFGLILGEKHVMFFLSPEI